MEEIIPRFSERIFNFLAGVGEDISSCLEACVVRTRYLCEENETSITFAARDTFSLFVMTFPSPAFPEGSGCR